MLYDAVHRHLAVGKLVAKLGPEGQEKYYRFWILRECRGVWILRKAAKRLANVITAIGMRFV
jgi:hypothetical protein